MGFGWTSLGSLALLNMSAKPLSRTGGRGIMAILSPAKTLDLKPYTGKLTPTSADCEMERTLQVAKAVKNCKNLKKLLGVSDNIAGTAKGYWEAFSEDETSRHGDETVKPCIFSFSGAAYQGLQIGSCTDNDIGYLQENLRIVDPLYGALRPLDRLQPYRLEMATKGIFGDKTKLADFWRESVTAHLSKDLKKRDSQVLLNLASDEYSAAVDPKALPKSTRYIKVVFQEEGRVIAVHAKRARGLMVRYLAQSNAQTLDDVRAFDEEGYRLDEKASDESTIVFNRKKGSNKRSAPAQNAKSSKNKK